MKVGDLRVFEDHVFGYGSVICCDAHRRYTLCRTDKNNKGKVEWWDRIVLFHDSKKYRSKKNVLDKINTTQYINICS